MCGNSFLNLGAYAPATGKIILKYQKILNKNLDTGTGECKKTSICRSKKEQIYPIPESDL
jgi:hypothetical protein